jgi:hypothetical protein
MVKEIISSEDLRAAFEVMHKSLTKPKPQDLAKIFNLSASSISFTKRALEEMNVRDLRVGDVVNVLRGCKIPYEPVFENGSWRCHVKTQKITVIVAFRNPGAITVLNTWRN